MTAPVRSLRLIPVPRPDKRLTLTRCASEGSDDGIPGRCVGTVGSLAGASG